MIIDCFSFFDELEILEIRLRELASVVDRFVLVEATRTFRGNPKPLYFKENQQRFSEFRDRITDVVLTGYPGIVSGQPWAMDWGQKQAGVQTMLNLCKPADNDLLLISDCDEIPRASAVRQFAESGAEGVAIPLMPIFYFWLNCRQCGPFERCAKWLTRGQLRQFSDSHSAVRQLRIGHEIKDGGWHFSYMGDVPTKTQAWAHSELDLPQFSNAAHLTRCKLYGLDPFGRNFQYEFLDDVSYLPDCVKQDRERFAHLIRQ